MSDDDRPLSRVRRAKSRQSPTTGVDGGAVAVGMVVVLGAHLVPALLLLLKSSASLVRITALASTVTFPLGSYVAGRYAGGNWERGGLHGVFAVTASLVVLGASAVVLVGTERSADEFSRLLVAGTGSEYTLLAGAVVCLLFAGIVAGAFGSN